MLGAVKAVGCACLLLSLASAQVNQSTPCPNPIPQKSAKLTAKQKLAAALFTAVEDDNLRAVKRLLAHTDANARDAHCSTPLMFAVVSDDTRVAEALLAAGAGVNAQDVAGWSALLTAADAANASQVK